MKKKAVDSCERRMAEIIPEVDYSKIYDKRSAKNQLILKLSNILAEECSTLELAGVVVGNLMYVFKDEKQVEEAVFAIVNITHDSRAIKNE